MNTVFKSMRALFVTIVVVLPFQAGALEDLPVCAVIEMDKGGGLWVNGVSATIHSDVIRECPAGSMFIVAPDFSAPAGGFLKLVAHLRALERPTKMFMPSSRRVIEELFGFDSLRECQDLSDRAIDPVPPTESVAGHQNVKVTHDLNRSANGIDIVALTVPPSIAIGIPDDVAESGGAYQQRGGFRLIVKAREEETAIRIEASDLYYPPPPRVERPTDNGAVDQRYVDERELCIYPTDGQR